MKKLVLLALSAIIMVGCEEKGYKGGNVDGFDIIIVDSCEYIFSPYGHGGVMAHKGNCKYCQQRLRQMMWEVQDSILNTMD